MVSTTVGKLEGFSYCWNVFPILLESFPYCWRFSGFWWWFSPTKAVFSNWQLTLSVGIKVSSMDQIEDLISPQKSYCHVIVKLLPSSYTFIARLLVSYGQIIAKSLPSNWQVNPKLLPNVVAKLLPNNYLIMTKLWPNYDQLIAKLLPIYMLFNAEMMSSYCHAITRFGSSSLT